MIRPKLVEVLLFFSCVRISRSKALGPLTSKLFLCRLRFCGRERDIRVPSGGINKMRQRVRRSAGAFFPGGFLVFSVVMSEYRKNLPVLLRKVHSGQTPRTTPPIPLPSPCVKYPGQKLSPVVFAARIRLFRTKCTWAGKGAVDVARHSLFFGGDTLGPVLRPVSERLIEAQGHQPTNPDSH